jgi:hypothetical protein
MPSLKVSVQTLRSVVIVVMVWIPVRISLIEQSKTRDLRFAEHGG